MSGFPSTATVRRIREQYPVGTRVVLDYMDDVHAPPTGTEGTVMYVDDIATVHVQWDTGGVLGVAWGEDRIHKS